MPAVLLLVFKISRAISAVIVESIGIFATAILLAAIYIVILVVDNTSA